MNMQTKTERYSKTAEPLDSGGCARAASAWRHFSVAQTFLSAVSQAFQPAARSSGGCARAASAWPRSARPATAGLLALLLLPALARAQDGQPVALQQKTIVERGLHYKIVQTTNGGTYTELGTAM